MTKLQRPQQTGQFVRRAAKIKRGQRVRPAVATVVAAGPSLGGQGQLALADVFDDGHERGKTCFVAFGIEAQRRFFVADGKRSLPDNPACIDHGGHLVPGHAVLFFLRHQRPRCSIQARISGQ